MRVRKSNFTIFVKIEYQASCMFDYLEIKEASGTSLALLCGDSLPSSIISSESTITIKFHSDGAQNMIGFSLIYFAMDGSK